MSYLARLVQQSGLDVAGGPPAAPPAGDAATRPDGVGTIEVDAARDAPVGEGAAPAPPPSPDVCAAEARDGRPPSRVSPDVKYVARDPVRHPRPDDHAPASTTDRDSDVSARADAPGRSVAGEPRTARPSEESHDAAMRVLQRVVEWVAAGPQPDALPEPHAPAAEAHVDTTSGVEVTRVEPARRPEDDASDAVARRVTSRDARSHELDVVERPRPGRRDAPAAVERRGRDAPREEVVEVSVGSIHVRVEGERPQGTPGRTEPNVTPDPPGRPLNASRLRRHYVRP